MRIGICDDDKITRDKISRLCKEFEKNRLMEFDLKTFSSCEDLVRYDKKIDILFLDVQMRGMSGMEAAIKIREKDESMFIIFITGNRSFMQQGYKVRAFRYMLKPLSEDEFMVTLGEVIREIKKNCKVIIDKHDKTCYINPKEIIYIEYGNRVSLVRTKSEYFESNKTMNEWEKLLDIGVFYRVHKSYIVNMLYVDIIDELIHMENGEKVKLAVKKASKFKNAMLEFRRHGR